MTDRDDPFLRKRPCSDCPFRSRPPAHPTLPGHGLFTGLRPERITEIADSLAAGAMFPCHKSLYGPAKTPRPHWCAGALATILRTGQAWNNPGTRFAAAAGMFDPADFRPDTAPVHPTLEDWADTLTARYQENR